MATDEKMDLTERRKYLRIMQKAYRPGDRGERGRLLDTMEMATGLERKTLIRLMAGDLKRTPRQRERGKTYGREIDRVLRVLAESTDFICAERLTPSLLELAEQLARHGEVYLTETLRQQLGAMSEATVSRRLAQFRQDEPQRPRRRPRPRTGTIQSIPMRRIPWDERAPGHFEVDLVHHAGVSAEGQYVHTLQMVDVASGWSERVAVLGRAYLAMADGFRRCQVRLPVAVLEWHPDNGSEFLNDLMLDFWLKQPQPPHFSRSRPYQKNDNRFVEQKNQSLVRVYFGTERLDTVLQTNLLNALYDRLWLFNNFFQPVLRLAEKQVTQVAGQYTVKRRFDQARTPFDRLCASGALAPATQTSLEQLQQRTNPRHLRNEIYELIDQVLSRPTASPGQTQDVRQTLLPAGCWSGLPYWQPKPAPATPAVKPPAPAPASQRSPRPNARSGQAG